MSILEGIKAYKRAEVAAGKAERPQGEIEAAARAAGPSRSFVEALRRASAAGGYGLIAEIKRASPSKGLIREDFDPATLAAAYAAGGAACLSVLTDGPSFQGDAAHLAEARGACSLPVLRKDFIVDPWQAAESRAMGADAILIILAMLDDAEAAEIEAAAVAMGLDVLVEAHSAAEIERAKALRSPLLGINNRNLDTFVVDLNTTRSLVRNVPEGRLIVAESGISTRQDLAQLARFGVRCFLVGEALMREANVEAATRELLRSPWTPGGRLMAGPELTHFDEAGAARMVDVAQKPATARVAVARGAVRMAPATLALVQDGRARKGDVLGVARIAGVMAAKRAADLIPLCHPLALTSVALDLVADEAGARVLIEARVGVNGPTGVEMEALTAVSVAALTVYDMLKAADRGMVIEDIRVVLKDGGKSGRYEAE